MNDLKFSQDLVFTADYSSRIVLSILSLPGFIVTFIAIKQNEPFLYILFPFLFGLYFLTFPMRHKIIVNEQGISYKSFIKYKFISWEDISKFQNEFSVERTKPTMSLSIYKFREKEPTIMINVKIFSSECYQFLTKILKEQVEKNKEARKLRAKTKKDDN